MLQVNCYFHVNELSYNNNNNNNNIFFALGTQFPKAQKFIHANCFITVIITGPSIVSVLTSSVIILGHRIPRVTDDPRETTLLFQRISVAIQRFNAVVLSNLFCNTLDNTTNLSNHTFQSIIFYNNFFQKFFLIFPHSGIEKPRAKKQ